MRVDLGGRGEARDGNAGNRVHDNCVHIPEGKPCGLCRLECHLLEKIDGMSAEGFRPLLPTAAAVIPVGRLTSVARIDSRVGIEIVAIGEVWKKAIRSLGRLLLSDLVFRHGRRDGGDRDAKTYAQPAGMRGMLYPR